MKATGQYYPVVLFITLLQVVLTFKSDDEIQWWFHSHKTSSRRLYFNGELFFLTAVKRELRQIFWLM